MNKRYMVRHCSNREISDKTWYEAHYSRRDMCAIFTESDYGQFLKFTALLKEAGYKYIENEDEY
jgi:hypothetical protein|tara:strand:- start:26 stop:217 length:192 start_codon:yes stop_codon:yes gene_type:complete